MRKLIVFFLLTLAASASAQWGHNAIRVLAGSGVTVTYNNGDYTISSSVVAGTVDSLSIVNVSVAATDLVNGSVLYAKLGTGVVDSVKAKDGGLINADLRVSTLDSSRIAPSGLTQSDVRVSAFDSSRVAPSGLTQSDIRVSALDSSRVAPSGLTQSDVRVSAFDSSRVAPSGLTQADIRVSALDSSRIAPNGLTTGDYRNSSVSAAKILKSDAFSWSGAHTHTAFQTAPDLLEFLGGALQATTSAGASDTTANYMPMKAFSVNDTATFDIFLSKRFTALDSIVVYAYSNTATSAVVFNCGVRQTAVGDAIAGAFNAAATKTISTGTAGTLRQWSMTSFGSLTASTPSMLRGKIYRTAGGTGGDVFVNRVLIYGVGLR